MNSNGQPSTPERQDNQTVSSVTEGPPDRLGGARRRVQRLLGALGGRGHAPAGGGKVGPSLFICLLLGFFAGALFLLLPPKPFQSVEWKLYDLRLRWRNTLLPQPISENILVVGIDERDRYIYGREEYPRWMCSKLLETLRRYRVEAAVFDIMFVLERPNDDVFANNMLDVSSFLAVGFLSTRFDRQPAVPPPPDFVALHESANRTRSPEEAWNVIERLRDYVETLESVQAKMAEQETLSPEKEAELAIRMGWVRFLIDEYLEVYYVARYSRPFDENLEGNPYNAEDIQIPSPPLLRAAGGAGFINTGKGEEEIVRRIPLVYSYRNRLFPCLDLLVMLHHYGATYEECDVRFGEALEFPIHRNGQGVKRIPINIRGEFLVNFRQGEDYIARAGNHTLSFYIHPQYAAQRAQEDIAAYLRDAIVLVGETAQGSSDVHPIPLQPLFPLVGVHANVFDNILKDDYIRLAPLWLEVLLVFAVGGLVGLTFAKHPSGRATRITAGIVIVYLLLQFAALLYYGNLILPIARVLATAAGSYVFLALYTVGVIERDRRMVKEVFLKSVSPRIGEEILRRFNDPSLWASRRCISVLFVDIRGFTPLSEKLEPDKLVEILDLYYDTVSEIVFHHDGQVNKFVGDAVMALYGALPGESDNHAERAVRTAVDIHLAIEGLNARFKREGKDTELRVGVGVNTGDVVVGTVGRRKIRIEYTAIGDTVNTAERLQGQAGAGRIYVGLDTLESIRALTPHLVDSVFRFTRVEGLTLKGKTRSVEVFECRYDAAVPRPAETIPLESTP